MKPVRFAILEVRLFLRLFLLHYEVKFFSLNRLNHSETNIPKLIAIRSDEEKNISEKIQ